MSPSLSFTEATGKEPPLYWFLVQRAIWARAGLPWLLQLGLGPPEKEVTPRPGEATDAEKWTPDDVIQTRMDGAMDFSVTEPIVSLLSCLDLSQASVSYNQKAPDQGSRHRLDRFAIRGRLWTCSE